MKKLQKFLSMVTATFMVFGMLSVTAFAAEGGNFAEPPNYLLEQAKPGFVGRAGYINEHSSYMDANRTYTVNDPVSYFEGGTNVGFKARNLECPNSSATLVVKLQYYKKALIGFSQVTAGSTDMTSRLNAGTAFYGSSWNCSNRVLSSQIDYWADEPLTWTYTIANNGDSRISNSYGDWVKYSTD